MSPFELLRLAIGALLANRLRSALTVLGIVIGVAAVIVLVSFGQSYQRYVDGQFQGIGATTLVIFRNFPKGLPTRPKPLTMGDVAAIANPQNVSGVEAVTPVYSITATLFGNQTSLSQSITGTTDLYAEVRNQIINTGRFITATDVTNSAPVAVLGTFIVQKFFPTGNPLGQPLRINGQVFTVVGVLQSSGGGAGAQDKVVIVPITTAQSRLGGADARTATGEYQVSQIAVKVVNGNVIPQTQTDITTLLSARHAIKYVGEEDFRVFSASAILNRLNSVLSLLTLFLAMIASISLLVGGIGVMNIMLVTVTERTREIGLRKALGAKYLDLLMQFLIESTTLCISGGFIGVAIGATLAFIGGLFLPQLNVTLSIPAIVVSVLVSSAIGIFFGLYPASRAAILKPIEALRYE